MPQILFNIYISDIRHCNHLNGNVAYYNVIKLFDRLYVGKHKVYFAT